MRRVLMICYYFPPLGGIGSIRALKFAKHLPEFGWSPVVVAPRDGAYYKDGSAPLNGTYVCRTGNIQPSRILGTMFRTSAGASSLGHYAPAAALLPTFLRRWLYRPDGQIGWYPFALLTARRLLREAHFDAIFSSSFPITAHLVARRLHRNTGVPWVAEFRDLWTDWGSETPRRQRRDERTERSILAEATGVVTVSPTYASVLQSRGARYVSVVTNGFDPADFSEESHPDSAVVTYVGSYYPESQDLATALRALGGIARDGGLPRLELRFVGGMAKSLDKVLAESGLTDVVQCTGITSHKEAVRYICESKVLLLGGPISAERNALRGNIAAKTFEYLGSRRSILFVGDPNSDVAQLLRPFPNVRIVNPGDEDGARDGLLSLLRENQPPAASELERFTSRSVTKGLADTLDRACR